MSWSSSYAVMPELPGSGESQWMLWSPTPDTDASVASLSVSETVSGIWRGPGHTCHSGTHVISSDPARQQGKAGTFCIRS